MSEWWTYSLSDFLLFSPHTYYRLFELYNAAIWPAQILALALAVAILVLLRAGGAGRDRVIAELLAAAWLWVAWAYLLERYDTINWAARYFAIGFAIEALLLIAAGLLLGRLRFQPAASVTSRLGLGLFLFALVLQPLIGPLVGRQWTQLEIFGVAPDPTVVGTLGLLLTAAGRAVWLLLVIPLHWCAISGLTLWTMASPDALVVPAAAMLVLFLAAWKALSRPHAQGVL
ncbi:MAG TPA: DUF6064 family protein [Dongiaceae bacterium]|nr:DUF6064 family protein [Dongiaceae bacterium]